MTPTLTGDLIYADESSKKPSVPLKMKGKIEELKLLALCMATDNREAFSRLVELHQEGLRRFLFNLSGDAMLTDDLAQETFLKAWLGIRSFKGLSGFRTWLYRIAVNEYVSWRRNRQAAMLGQAADLTSLTSGEPSVSCTSDAGMDAQTLLATLKDTERMVTILFYINDMSIKEITKVTGMAEGTIKSHLSRARRKMAAVK